MIPALGDHSRLLRIAAVSMWSFVFIAARDIGGSPGLLYFMINTLIALVGVIFYRVNLGPDSRWQSRIEQIKGLFFLHYLGMVIISLFLLFVLKYLAK
ncbi:MAG: hypothetical protein R3C11_14150 [Planctomycetaceae bacterium]